MSENAFLKLVLGESADTESAEDADSASGSHVSSADPTPDPAPVVPVAELARMWQAGQKMDVATSLMFTPASYADFVDLCFVIGQEAGRELGHLLDELADSENIPVPEPSDDYASILQRVSTHRPI